MKKLGATQAFNLAATISLCAVASLQVSCVDAEAATSNNGLVSTTSERMVNSIFTDLDESIQANPNISVVGRVNHSMNAATANLALRPTQVIFFGNPQLGTPLMQSQQTVGIDLPQKIAILETAEGSATLLWNSALYLQNRHALTGVNEPLNTIRGALENLATAAADNDVVSEANADVALGEGLIQQRSNQSFAETLTTLRNAITDNSNLNLVFELDHQANAERVGLTLRPTHLLVFGNPAAGTPLMQNQQGTAIDLPQKMLVYQDASGVVRVAYNDPAYIAKRHGISGEEQRLATIGSALNALATTATQ